MGNICPSATTMAAFVDGKIEGKEHEKMIFHINHCESCSQVLSETLHTLEEFPELILNMDSETSLHAFQSDKVESTVNSPVVTQSKVQQHALKEVSRKDIQGMIIIKNNILLAMSVGLIPLPLLDILGTSAIQLKMLNQLSSLYEIPFSKHLGKSGIGLLIGGLGVNGLSRTGLSLAKAIPGFGLTGGIVMIPLATGVSTYAIGKIFLQHFSLGGTFLDFNPATVREHFSKLYTEGHALVSNLNSNNSKKNFQVA